MNAFSTHPPPPLRRPPPRTSSHPQFPPLLAFTFYLPPFLRQPTPGDWRVSPPGGLTISVPSTGDDGKSAEAASPLPTSLLFTLKPPVVPPVVPPHTSARRTRVSLLSHKLTPQAPPFLFSRPLSLCARFDGGTAGFRSHTLLLSGDTTLRFADLICLSASSAHPTITIRGRSP